MEAATQVSGSVPRDIRTVCIATAVAMLIAMMLTLLVQQSPSSPAPRQTHPTQKTAAGPEEAGAVYEV